MKIDIKDTTKEPKEQYELGKLYKDKDGDVFYFVQAGEHFDANYLIVDGCLKKNVIKVSSAFQSIQEVVNGFHIESSDIPETPIPAKKLTIEF